MAHQQVQYNGYEMNLPRALDEKNLRLLRQPKQRIWAEKIYPPTFDIQKLQTIFWGRKKTQFFALKKPKLTTKIFDIYLRI